MRMHPDRNEEVSRSDFPDLEVPCPISLSLGHPKAESSFLLLLEGSASPGPRSAFSARQRFRLATGRRWAAPADQEVYSTSRGWVDNANGREVEEGWFIHQHGEM